VRAPNLSLPRSQSESSSTRVHRIHHWVSQHVVADDPYDDEDFQQVGTEESTPFWTGGGLALMLLSAFISITGLMMLWTWLAG
jgi:hypothetical protein